MIITKMLTGAALLLALVYVLRHWSLDETCGPSEECASCPFPCEHHRNDQTGRGRTEKGKDL